ncbi:MAG: DUF819 family protein [Alphaproteobacteria bacterium]|nr:MAG: DUF819 family protein [Alphaproteobacteria bacterium]
MISSLESITPSFVDPSNHIALMAILFLGAYVGLTLNKVKALRYLSPVFLTMAFMACLSNTHIIPNEAPAYDFVWGYFIPLSIPLILMRADLKTVFKAGGPTLTAFMFGTIGTILGTITVFTLFEMPGELGKLVSMFCATYIGGSVNFATVSQALELRDSQLFSAGVAADNITMALYFTTLGLISVSAYMLKLYPVNPELTASTHHHTEKEQKLDVFQVLMAVFVSLGIFAVSKYLSTLIKSKTGYTIDALLFVTTGSIIFANACRDLAQKLHQAEVIGYALLQVFFGVIGASADVVKAFTVAPQIFLMTVTLLCVQLLVIFSLSRMAGLDLRSIIIACNANVGGPGTAAAMATSFGWREQVVPGILTGVLGYAIANYIGVGMAKLYGIA